MSKVKYVTTIKKVDNLSEEEKKKLLEVESKYKFRSNSYYNSLIDWDDENDPIRTIIIPKMAEIEDEVFVDLDASSEHLYTKAKGVEHKYNDTALIIFNNVCGGYCRFCFRKRLFIDDNDDVVNDLSEAVEYMREHKEIKSVLITGGDPFVAGYKKVFKFIREIIDFDHIEFIRIGTKMLAFNPEIFINENLQKELSELTKRKNIKIMNHINHPREITDVTREAIKVLKSTGVVLYNQTPIIRGVNDNSKTIQELLIKLDEVGIIPYYFFQMRPTAGNFDYSVPIENVVNMIGEATKDLPGPMKTFKYVMSHKSGKIEILGTDDNSVYMRYHRAAKDEDANRVLVFKRDKEARWLDDYLNKL